MLKLLRSLTQRSTVILIIIIFAGSLWIAAQTGFAQDTKYLVTDQDSSFTYYDIIEQRNFFRPKKDVTGKSNTASFAGNQSQPAGTPAAENASDLVLTGVIEIKNGYKAIVEGTNPERGFYVSVNEAIGDYIVKEIQPNKIILEKNGRPLELRLKQAGTKSPEPADESAAENNGRTTGAADGDNQPAPAGAMQKLRMGIRGQK